MAHTPSPGAKLEDKIATRNNQVCGGTWAQNFPSASQLSNRGRDAMKFAMKGFAWGVVWAIFALTVTAVSAEMPSLGESYAQGFTPLHFSRKGIFSPHCVREQRVRADRCSAAIERFQPCGDRQVMCTTCERSPSTMTSGHIRRASSQWREGTTQCTASASRRWGRSPSLGPLSHHSLIYSPCCLTFDLCSGDFPKIFFRGAAPLHPAEA
jgi:hypothetical protein